AGRASEYAGVIAILAETLGVERPSRCAVAIAVQDEQSVVAFADARGETDGAFGADRRSPTLDPKTLVPARIVDRLRSCDRVTVLARAPVLGAAGVLPPDLAWSFALPGPARAGAPTANSRRLVVASPVIPPELHLPPLGAFPDEPTANTVVLR